MAQPIPAPKKGEDGIQPSGALWYALIAFAGLGVAIVVGWYLTQRLEVLASYGPQAYYVLLIMLSIAVAVFLFGVLRSTATVRGTHFGYAIELGGPAAAAALVVVGGYWFGIPLGEFALTVFVRSDQPECPCRC